MSLTQPGALLWFYLMGPGTCLGGAQDWWAGQPDGTQLLPPALCLAWEAPGLHHL